MQVQKSRILIRALGRVKRLSNRACARIRGLPIRASQRVKGTPLPPGRLMHLVAGTEDVAWFLHSGAMAARSLGEILAKNRLDIETFGDILDFGCGAGRVIRHWSEVRGPVFHGADYNPALVAWCRANLGFARFQVNGLDRRFASDDASFDFIYAFSVFTHLSEPLQRFWIDELWRVLRPGGHLLITTHGDYYLGQLSPARQQDFRDGRVVVLKATRQGSNDCAAFHPESYVRATLSKPFEVVDFIPEGALGNPRQDVYLLRKPVSA